VVNDVFIYEIHSLLRKTVNPTCCSAGHGDCVMMMMIMINLKCGRKRTALFWAITQRVVVIPYRLFGTTKILTLEDGTDRLSRNECKKLPLLAE
jgi:hypothetical protein